jgi:tRNA nucleotidyltransferase/poly(A) polymerase
MDKSSRDFHVTVTDSEKKELPKKVQQTGDRFGKFIAIQKHLQSLELRKCITQ